MAKVPRELQITVPQRLRLFDEATERQRRRQHEVEWTPAPGDRGWSREELYDRDRAP